MTNSKNNQSCLSCNHFQPYEQLVDGGVGDSNGECRKDPKVGRLVFGQATHHQYWPYIDKGSDYWCSRWKKTQLEVITQSGLQGPTFPDDWVNFHANPYNRHAALNESCWNCNHFQREYENPVNPGENLGQCRKNPPPPVLEEEPNQYEPEKFNYAGSSYFCSCWERNESVVPADPGGQIT